MIQAGRFPTGRLWLSVGPKRRPWLRADTCTKRRPELKSGQPRKGAYRVGQGMAQLGPVFVVLPRRSEA